MVTLKLSFFQENEVSQIKEKDLCVVFASSASQHSPKRARPHSPVLPSPTSRPRARFIPWDAAMLVHSACRGERGRTLLMAAAVLNSTGGQKEWVQAATILCLEILGCVAWSGR